MNFSFGRSAHSDKRSKFLKKRIESLLGSENFPFGSSLGFLDKGMENTDPIRTFNVVKHSVGTAGRRNSYFRNPSCDRRHWANVRHPHRLTLLKLCKDIAQVLPDAICPVMGRLSCWVRNRDLEPRGFSHFISRMFIVPLKGHTVKFCLLSLWPSDPDRPDGGASLARLGSEWRLAKVLKWGLESRNTKGFFY